MVIMSKNICGGNSRQRRKLRRYLNRVACPLVDAGMSLMEVALKVDVRFQVLYKHIDREGYIKEAWMYRRPIKGVNYE